MSTVITVWHASLQFSDSTNQKRHDVKKLFSEGRKQRILWITGTEAGGKKTVDTRRFLREFGDRYGYRVVFGGGDMWIAIRKSGVKKWRKRRAEIAIPGKAGQYMGKGVLAQTITAKGIKGRITVTAGHLLVRGRTSGIGGKRFRENIGKNRKILRSLNRVAKKMAKGRKLAFYGGDQNEIDKHADTFMGEVNFISCWDEAKKYPKTHAAGNIDVIARWKGDKRVELVSCRRYTDKQFFLHTDHLLIEASYRIHQKAPKKAKA